jgi:hypothetical protein
MCKPSDSLIRVCYDALQSKIHDQYMKWNWVRDVVELLAKWDCETVIRTVLLGMKLYYEVLKYLNV